jgi:hypothetical protein
MSIPHTEEKGKIEERPWITGLFWPFVIVLLGFLLYGTYLLRGSELSRIPPSITTETASSTNPVTIGSTSRSKSTETAKMFVASKSGNAYYLPTCATAQRIADKNKIWFESKEAAEKAGYLPAKNCKEMQ